LTRYCQAHGPGSITGHEEPGSSGNASYTDLW
jgi:hypothetical protein